MATAKLSSRAFNQDTSRGEASRQKGARLHPGSGTPVSCAANSRGIREDYRRPEQHCGLPVGPHEMILLYDPVKGVNYIVDAEHEVTRQFNLPAKAGTVQRDLLQSVPNRMSPELQTENLGSRTIEGLQCIGTKKTLHIPPGEIGNQAPIVAITETWYSAEIEGVVDSISSDPRYGTTHYKLQRVKRDEPSPELFVPPPQYKVEFVNTQ